MANEPKAEWQPQVELRFELFPEADMGPAVTKFEFKGMLNGGYVVRAQMSDPSMNLLKKLAGDNYFDKARKQTSSILKIKFRMKWGPKPSDDRQTQEQEAYVITMEASGGSSDNADITFIAVDPPSWFLNMGDASGAVYKGKVSNVIKKVVEEYAPDIELDISDTDDSDDNKWWMMRQDPKTFINSMLDWSSSVTKDKTNWIISPDGNKLSIKEQSKIRSRRRGYYKYWDRGNLDTIKGWQFIIDNALSSIEGKIVTHGLSAVSGQYLDRITDENEEKLFVKDSTTDKKKIANISGKRGFLKPDDSPGAKPQDIGWTSVAPIPEHSAGDVGMRYDEYIDGRARGIWLNMVNNLMRVKFKVIGHAEYHNCEGLGTDTIFVKWFKASEDGSLASDSEQLWFLSGNWIIYGFHHILEKGAWWTYIYAARWDRDASGEKVG